MFPHHVKASELCMYVSFTPVMQHTHRVDGVNQLAGLAELHETLPQVVEGPLHQDLLLLVVVQQVVP